MLLNLKSHMQRTFVPRPKCNFTSSFFHSLSKKTIKTIQDNAARGAFKEGRGVILFGSSWKKNLFSKSTYLCCVCVYVQFIIQYINGHLFMKQASKCKGHFSGIVQAACPSLSRHQYPQFKTLGESSFSFSLSLYLSLSLSLSLKHIAVCHCIQNGIG